LFPVRHCYKARDGPLPSNAEGWDRVVVVVVAAVVAAIEVVAEADCVTDAGPGRTGD
jgi:hypothetical protein